MGFENERAALTAQLRQYRPWSIQEEKDLQLILACLEKEEDIFLRTCLYAHMTASAWVLSSGRTQALMAWHNVYHSWSWLGGHADGEGDLLAVALREVREESGVRTVKPLVAEPFSVEVLTVDGHMKRGQYVSSHLHLNVTYLLEADEREPLAAKPDENSAVGWFPLDEAAAASSEPWMRERIYRKLNEKVKKLVF